MNSTHNQSDQPSNLQPLQQAARNQESKMAHLECCAVSELEKIKTKKIPLEEWWNQLKPRLNQSEWRLNQSNVQIDNKKPTINAPTIKIGIKKAWQTIQARSAPLNQPRSHHNRPATPFLAATHFAEKNRLNHRHFGPFFN